MLSMASPTLYTRSQPSVPLSPSPDRLSAIAAAANGGKSGVQDLQRKLREAEERLEELTQRLMGNPLDPHVYGSFRHQVDREARLALNADGQVHYQRGGKQHHSHDMHVVSPTVFAAEKWDAKGGRSLFVFDPRSGHLLELNSMMEQHVWLPI